MIHRPSLLILLTLCIAISSFNLAITPAYAEQKVKTDKIEGIVKDVLYVASYTYVEVKTKDASVWAAAPTTKIKVGSTIAFSTKMPMRNFRSKSIDRVFPLIYFVSQFETEVDSSKPKTQVTGSILKDIDKVNDGKTIAEIYAEKGSLKDKTIKIRAKVTKFSAQIMGKNWVHIQDSSSAKDLTVTTQETITIKDIVVIEGKLAVDKDFGHGYHYPVILEQAKVIAE